MIFKKKRQVLHDPRREAWLQWHDRMFGTPRLENHSAWAKLFRRYQR